MPSLARLLSAGVLILAVVGCSTTGDIFESPETTGNLDTDGLTVSAAHPPTGNGKLTVAATLVVDVNGNGYDEITLSQDLAGTSHEVKVSWDTLTQAIRGTSHVWTQGQDHGGPNSGFTACFAGINDCDPAKVAIDFAGKTVTFHGLVLADVFAGAATSTLDGTVGW